MGRTPTFFVAILLAMLAVLMGSHLAVLWVGVKECDEYARLLLQKLEAGQIEKIDSTNQECSNIEADWSETADRYIALILALLSGAGYAAGTALKKDNDK